MRFPNLGLEIWLDYTECWIIEVSEVSLYYVLTYSCYHRCSVSIIPTLPLMI